jgi:hypothetical protein
LLLAEADDKQTVASRWQIAHLWFDPDVCRPKLRHGYLWSFVDDGPDVVLLRRNQARKSLIASTVSEEPRQSTCTGAHRCMHHDWEGGSLHRSRRESGSCRPRFTNRVCFLDKLINTRTFA